ncbi:MAG: hypothetical protein EP343_31290 [Deltaproteobacteria bacterium]|nr:MAG: hypothetical protein EP343_31290 [Deltaproteobacteria bacterium]
MGLSLSMKHARWMRIAACVCLWGVLVLACVGCRSPLHSKHPRTIRLYGASPTGVYTRAMKQLAALLQKEMGGVYTFKVKTSAGSVENIRDLHSRLAQIALVQEDVAHYFEQGGHALLKVSHIKSSPHVKSVCFLFWEYFHVLARPKVRSLAEVRRINVGSLYGGSGVTAINLRDQLQYRWQFDTALDPVVAMRKPGVDAIVVLAHEIRSVTRRLRAAKILFHPVGMSNRERHIVTASFPFYHEAMVSVSDGKGIRHNIPTVGTRALLALQKDLPVDLVRTILRLFREPAAYKSFAKMLPEINSIKGGTRLDPNDSNNMRFARFPMPVHPAVFELHWGQRPYANLYLFGLPLLLFLLGLAYLRRGNRYQRWLRDDHSWQGATRHLFEKFWADVLLGLMLALYVVVATNWIKYLEIQAFLSNEVASPSNFVYMGFKELFTWIFVFTATGFEDAVFPKTMLGKILASSIRIVIISSVVFLLGRISADFIKTLIKGREMSKTYNLKDHIVICNWNRKGEKIVQELHSTLLQEHDMARPVIIITEQEIRFPDTPSFEDTFCIPGDPVSPWKLRNANIIGAYAVIILADEDKEQGSDTHTIMVAMEIAELLDEAEQQGLRSKRPHIAAEILDGHNAKYLRRSGVNEIISGNDLGVKLLAQTAVTPGVTAFMDDLLTYTSSSNEVYIVEPPSKLVAERANFTQIIHYLLEQRSNCEHALLVGIQRGEPPVMMVNPSASDFDGLEAGDKLVLIARKRPVF